MIQRNWQWTRRKRGRGEWSLADVPDWVPYALLTGAVLCALVMPLWLPGMRDTGPEDEHDRLEFEHIGGAYPTRSLAEVSMSSSPTESGIGEPGRAGTFGTLALVDRNVRRDCPWPALQRPMEGVHFTRGQLHGEGRTLGPEDASRFVVEFTDFFCHHCHEVSMLGAAMAAEWPSGRAENVGAATAGPPSDNGAPSPGAWGQWAGPHRVPPRRVPLGRLPAGSARSAVRSGAAQGGWRGARWQAAGEAPRWLARCRSGRLARWDEGAVMMRSRRRVLAPPWLGWCEC